ncbi:MAG: helix-turn-helix transcriptional regulator [Bacteroidota bacterium]|nr:helix-turn-helix transcriptional regulator [Bacteroidota bacterium]MDP4216722.1 helix-turn-helix transcriptional regulator [Bacteroidota bacterium]MDP4248441.1 helix-turn-helix transcriptional regulator [Bacteroidota bacterium]MDP4254442.1 helix-turn-helix transcriptional regulator [Bacteroidota bacterium]MDP4259272.1 helix-turn-helix transcriptional regulator [Bacteroidota bacterium]
MHYLGRNIRYLRKRLSKNQGEIAALVDKGQTTVGNWEKGVSEPSLGDLLILSNYFGISVDALLRTDLAESGRKEAVREEVGREEDRPDYHHEAEHGPSMVMERSEDLLIPILKEIESIRQEINEMKERLGS